MIEKANNAQNFLGALKFVSALEWANEHWPVRKWWYTDTTDCLLKDLPLTTDSEIDEFVRKLLPFAESNRDVWQALMALSADMLMNGDGLRPGDLAIWSADTMIDGHLLETENTRIKAQNRKRTGEKPNRLMKELRPQPHYGHPTLFRKVKISYCLKRLKRDFLLDRTRGGKRKDGVASTWSGCDVIAELVSQTYSAAEKNSDYGWSDRLASFNGPVERLLLDDPRVRRNELELKLDLYIKILEIDREEKEKKPHPAPTVLANIASGVGRRQKDPFRRRDELSRVP